MEHYRITSRDEQEFLAHYDIGMFERPSVAVDMAVFSVLGLTGTEEAIRDAENYRKLPDRKLKLLLIKRASYPYKDCWALPGGFCQKGENVSETAYRELREETNVESAYLKPIGIFGETDRDPRGWIISNLYLALMDGEACKLRAGSDAWEARWFQVVFSEREIEREIQENSATIGKEYTLQLLCEDSDTEPIVLEAVIREQKCFQSYHETVTYEIIKNTGFGFDHAKLITCAILKLRESVEEDGRIVFDLMPEMFTLTQLQRVFEIILDRKLLVANFRRKIADYCIETERSVEGAGHRPAKLFRRNLETFYR
ncbi:MAG: NUDIX hydrolase [Bacteroides sp.]|nr:NUDIX hydrolase [Bacteroides sp.]MCM1550878.1 NUDIX hydrolase [Clostridium sp.]